MEMTFEQAIDILAYEPLVLEFVEKEVKVSVE